MTLIVSLRIPDGIVLAGDSLATMMGNSEIQAKVDLECPHCKNHVSQDIKLQAPAFPATTFSYTQKVFPFCENFGVGTFGLGQLKGRTIYFAVRELEKQLMDSGAIPSNVTDASRAIFDRLQSLLSDQLVLEEKTLEQMPDDYRPLGCQVVGYDGDEAKTIEVLIGKNYAPNPFVGAGAKVSGQVDQVVLPMFNRYKGFPQEHPSFMAFSLQDAIDYAEFLISTTAKYQRFANSIPGVGGSIDIALVTPFDKFTWIRRKSLTSLQQ